MSTTFNEHNESRVIILPDDLDYVGESKSGETVIVKKGKLTETKEGKPIAKLMGKFIEYDGGYTSVGTSPFNSFAMCNDFATLFISENSR